MNIQKQGGIEWTRVLRWDEETGQFYQLPGATWNPTAGCFHGCTWKSINGGAIAQCYAKSVAEGLAKKSYPDGFESHYWYPNRLRDPLVKKSPHGVFVGSMGDLFGAWVPEGQIKQVIDVMRGASWHTFMVLTKNPKRLKQFSPFPPNVWVGMSLPTEGRLGRGTAIFNGLHEMAEVDATVRFLSAEPLWHDAASSLMHFGETQKHLPLDWVIVGAMSRGSKIDQPGPDWVQHMLYARDEFGFKVFMKNKLTWSPRLVEFPLVR